MCGIAGILDKRNRLSPDLLREIVAAMAGEMVYRGPDDSGVWLSTDGRCALAHRRLSILDVSSAGHQPMTSEAERSALTYNGELYNFVDVRGELEKLGVAFSTRSDTEIVLKAIDRWHIEALQKFDGMFAFGHYDAQSQVLLLARDIFGEKPLYYIETADILAFSSELHALTKLPDFDAKVELDTIAAFLCYQYVPAPSSIYRAVKKLPPASFLVLRPGTEARVQRYFHFRTSPVQTSGRDIDDLADELEDVLVRSVRQRLVADVPVGAFLSGGVDSSVIAALVRRRLDLPLKTFSIGFANHPESEHFDAAEIGSYLGTDHRDQVLQTYALDLGRHIGSILDEPNADSSCLPTYLVSRHAREQVTVVLSGDGGDELFGGYNRYFNTWDEERRQRSGDRSLDWWRLGDVYLGNRILVFPENEVEAALGVTPDRFSWRLGEDRRLLEADERPLINVLRESDANTYLPGDVLAKVDRMSMQHSLEVRAPLLGMEVAKFAMRLAADDCYDGGQGKRVLRRVATRHLPEAWVNRPKRGFGMPMQLWDQSVLMPENRRLLLSSESRLAEWIDRKQIAAYLDKLDANFSPYRAWTFFILEHWLRTHPAVPA